MTWEEVCADPALDDLPYKIELNKWGNIEMSPAKIYHGEFQSEISHLLRTLLPNGVAMTECAVQTIENTKVPDVSWISLLRRREAAPRDLYYTLAPEICVEIFSMSNALEEQMHKGALYLQAGAREFWLCDEKGAMRFFNAGGEMKQSQLCPSFPARVVLPD